MNLSDDAGSLEWYDHPDGSANGSFIIYHSQCSRPDEEDGQCRCDHRKTFYPRMHHQAEQHALDRVLRRIADKGGTAVDAAIELTVRKSHGCWTQLDRKKMHYFGRSRWSMSPTVRAHGIKTMARLLEENEVRLGNVKRTKGGRASTAERKPAATGEKSMD